MLLWVPKACIFGFNEGCQDILILLEGTLIDDREKVIKLCESLKSRIEKAKSQECSVLFANIIYARNKPASKIIEVAPVEVG